MDELIRFAKENFQLIILFVSMLGVMVAVITLISEIKAKKRRQQNNDEKPQ